MDESQDQTGREAEPKRKSGVHEPNPVSCIAAEPIDRGWRALQLALWGIEAATGTGEMEREREREDATVSTGRAVSLRRLAVWCWIANLQSPSFRVQASKVEMRLELGMSRPSNQNLHNPAKLSRLLPRPTVVRT